MNETIKLQIGGLSSLTGWHHFKTTHDFEITRFQAGLSRYDDASVASVYLVDVLQRVSSVHWIPILQNLNRMLAPGGELTVTVPDLDTLCRLYTTPQLGKSERMQVMRLLFGSQSADHESNRAGLSFEWLTDALLAAGFGFVRKVDDLGSDNQLARYAPFQTPIMLNVVATKLVPHTVMSIPQIEAQNWLTQQWAKNTLALTYPQSDNIQPLPSNATRIHPPQAELSPADAEALQNKVHEALALQHANQTDEAAAAFLDVLELQPNNFPALYSLAVIASQKEEHVEALEWIQKAIATGQNYAPSFFVEAVILQALGRFEESLVSYERAIAADPTYESAMINRSNLYYEMKQHGKALLSFADALNANPQCDKALAGQGIILTEMNRYDEAIPLFERLLAANPDFDYGPGLLLHAEQHCCDWRRFSASLSAIERGVRDGKRVCKTLPFMSISNSPDDLLQCVRIFSEHLYPEKNKALWQGERYQHDKIRLAYVSPDFREHPVGHLMAGVIENHDKSRFETIAFSLGIDDKGALRRRFEQAFDRFIDVRGRKSWDIAQMIRAMEIDILVDLAGYTADSRTDVFAYRPAPIQVNYLGYPGSLGVSYMDYILADRIVIPEEHQKFYAEKVAYLPDAYLPTDSNLTIADRTPTREDMGLPATGVVFCSFNHDYKINPPIFDIWMRLLDKVPGSVLWLMKLNEPAQHNLRREAEQRGIHPDRLIFATRVPKVEDHLARYRLADMFLDTTPYNAHTTASDCLRVGLPVITYLGNTFSGRVAASLLHAIGMPELITHSLDDYETLALELANDPERLAGLKAKLLANQASYPLFKTDLFCRNLEQVFVNMMEQ